MAPPPFYRWKSFWLGLLVLAFLIWSWIASIGAAGAIEVGTPLINAGAVHTNGNLILFYNGSSGDFGMGWTHSSAPADQTWLSSPVEVRYSKGKDVSISQTKTLPNGASHKSILCGYSPAHGHVGIAHWLFIPIYLVSWIAFLLWRVRRMKRLAAET